MMESKKTTLSDSEVFARLALVKNRGMFFVFCLSSNSAWRLFPELLKNRTQVFLSSLYKDISKELEMWLFRFLTVVGYK